MILYGSSISPFVRKVLVFAAEKGVSLEVRPVAFADQDEGFREASPFGKMPALRDGDFALSDSSAIVHYLEAAHPEPALIPSAARERGRTIWFDEFADTVLFECGRKIFFNRIVAPRFLKRAGDEAVAERALHQELPPILDYLERQVPADGGFLVGDRLTLADIAVVSPFVNFLHLGIALDDARHPRTRAYVDRILARPSFAALVAREVAFMARTAPQ
jgi:glutathione S-transferase